MRHVSVTVERTFAQDIDTNDVSLLLELVRDKYNKLCQFPDVRISRINYYKSLIKKLEELRRG